MKKTRMKILFTIFLFSAAVPSVTQAMGIVTLKAGCNFLRKPSNVMVVAGGFLCSYFAWQLSKIISIFCKIYNEVNDCKREFLAKVDTGKLIENPLGGKYCLTLPEQSLVEKNS